MGIIETSIILILYMSGSIMEHVDYDNISACLRAKRQIERTGWKDSQHKRYACEKRTVELKEGIDGKPYVLKIVE
jgi:hypothetical protein